jgi:HlyD family secretion protein
MSSVPSVYDCYVDVPRSTRNAKMLGFLLIAISFLGFGAWASTALIAGATVAPGLFVVTGENKIIQHLEGGVIRSILVREGQVVDAGQTLIQLDETTPKAELRRLVLKHARLLAMEARLKAQVAEAPAVNWPAELASQADADLAEIRNTQQEAFDAQRKNLQSDIVTIEEGIAALEARIAGSRTQLASVEKQLGYYEEELKTKSGLFQGGLIRKPEVLQLQRAQAAMQGEIGRINGDIGDSRERIARSREQINGVRKAAIKAAVEQLHEVAADLYDTRERMRAARGVLDRITITSPVHGVVVKLRYHTAGGVIEAGKNIMEILPLQDELIIEARVRIQDIDNVKVGQDATVRLTALNKRITPMIEGKVIYVSADSVSDEQKGQQGQQAKTSTDVYVARVRLDKDEAERLHNFRATPGMPAEVYIKTGERTFLEYLLKPIRDSMSRAFREN